MKLKQVISIGALVLGSSAAIAGNVQPAQVTITLNADGSGSATGDLFSARFADNDFEVIGCGVRRYDDGVDGVYAYIFCQAANEVSVNADPENGSKICYSENPALIEALASLNDYSYITFAWDAEGTCTAIGNSTNSFYLPEKLGPDT